MIIIIVNFIEIVLKVGIGGLVDFFRKRWGVNDLEEFFRS